MDLTILAALASFSLGFGLGRYWRKALPRVLFTPANATPPYEGANRPRYEVRLDSKAIYAGEDLQEAKAVYRSHLPIGYVAELYTAGNHVASRIT